MADRPAKRIKGDSDCSDRTSVGPSPVDRYLMPPDPIFSNEKINNPSDPATLSAMFGSMMVSFQKIANFNEWLLAKVHKLEKEKETFLTEARELREQITNISSRQAAQSISSPNTPQNLSEEEARRRKNQRKRKRKKVGIENFKREYEILKQRVTDGNSIQATGPKESDGDDDSDDAK